MQLSFKNFKNKRIFAIIIIVLLAFFITWFMISLISRDKEVAVDLPESEKSDERQPVIIPIEFLEPEELIDLGVKPDTKAQIIQRDPLIYKVIRDDSDIVEDISPYLDPIRE